MAHCFVGRIANPSRDGLAVRPTERKAEEFFFMNWTGKQILEIFQNPFYRGPHTVYQRYGEDWVKSLINDVAESLRERHQRGSGT